MWIEAILLKTDLESLLAKLLPVDIELGGGGRLSLRDASNVALLPDAGVRVTCKATVRWPVIGISVPVVLHSLAVLLRPKVTAGPSLVFELEVEHADFAALPDAVDNRLTDRINRELAAKHVALTWKMTESLTHDFELPDMLRPLETLRLGVADARVKVTGDALGLALLFRFDIDRGQRATHDGDARPQAPRARESISRTARDLPAGVAVAGGALVVAALAGVAVGALAMRGR